LKNRSSDLVGDELLWTRCSSSSLPLRCEEETFPCVVLIKFFYFPYCRARSAMGNTIAMAEQVLEQQETVRSHSRRVIIVHSTSAGGSTSPFQGFMFLAIQKQ